jgi:hypothetical protein
VYNALLFAARRAIQALTLRIFQQGLADFESGF